MSNDNIEMSVIYEVQVNKKKTLTKWITNPFFSITFEQILL